MFTSSDNATSFEHVAFRHSFTDTWFSEAMARDTEALTRALQRSLTNDPLLPAPAAAAAALLESKPDTTQSSVSDPETASRRPRNPIPIAGKSTKRKSRASKRSPTTFINADPSNFRQMVQQVTGIRLGRPSVPASPVLKPEPQRPGGRMQMCLPTLDTSAFLLDHHQQQPPAATAPVSFAPDCAAGFEFDASFPTFPTLESWRVM